MRAKPYFDSRASRRKYGLPLAKRLLLATRKRVFALLESYLVWNLVFTQLVLDVLRYLFCIFACCIYTERSSVLIATAPESSVAILTVGQSLYFRFPCRSCIRIQQVESYDCSYLSRTLRSYTEQSSVATLIFGGISTSIWTWSGHICASTMVTSFQLHSSLNIFPMSALNLPYIIFLRYFGAKT